MTKQSIKGFVCGAVAATVLMGAVGFADSAQKTLTAFFSGVKIVVNGEQIDPKDAGGNSVEPFIVDGTTYLPLRALAAALGETVNWDEAANTVYVGGEMAATAGSVNGETLSKDELSFLVKQYYYSFMYNLQDPSAENALETQKVNGEIAWKALGKYAFDELSDLTLQAARAKELGLDASADFKKELSDAYQSTVDNLGGADGYQTYLTQNAITDKALKSLIEKNILSKHLYDYVTENSEQVKAMTDEKAEDYFLANYVKAKHILIPSGDGAQAAATAIIGRLKKGEAFEKLIGEYDNDPGQDAEKGYVFTKGEMVFEFEDAAFALTAGKFTETPVLTSYGYHIIKRYPLEKGSAEFTEQKDTLLQNVKGSAYSEALTKLKSGAQVVMNEGTVKSVVLGK